MTDYERDATSPQQSMAMAMKMTKRETVTDEQQFKTKHTTISLWDTLPYELHQRILHHADPFTKYLHGLLPAKISPSTSHALWKTIFEIDWDGDIGSIPYSDELPGTLQGLLEIRSWRMYDNRRGALFFANLKNGRWIILVALHRGWWDYLQPFESIMGDYASFYGYYDYILHLVNDRNWEQTRTAVFEVDFGEVSPVELAAHSGNLQLFDYLESLSELPRLLAHPRQSVLHAAWGGHLDLIHHLYQKYPNYFDGRVLTFAAQSGSLEVVQFVHEHCIQEFSESAIDMAACCGHLHIVKFLHENRNDGCSIFALDFAAKHGHEDVVKFLAEHRREGCSTIGLRDAAGKGYTSILKILHSKCPQVFSEAVISQAAATGQVECVEYLLDQYPVGFDRVVLETAITRGHVSVVELLHRRTLDGKVQNAERLWTPALLGVAVRKRGNYVVKFLLEKIGVGYTRDALDYAKEAQMGNIVELLMGRPDLMRV
ncbi:hypothetical protein HDV05_001226 [Chytridiales sp. JEL 0842]|nr:hypothetical protein HDV05_001226 [Chytridiales sp. JEL 0842]